MARQVLCAWLGNSDLKEAIGNGNGPIVAALREATYHNLLLLSAQPESETERYVEWLKTQTPVRVFTVPVTLEDPTDFTAIYQAAKKAVANHHQAVLPGTMFTYHLSPGTPAMQTVWIILAHTYLPGNLIQAHRETGISKVVLPFETATDFMPQLVGLTRHEFTHAMTDSSITELFGSFPWRSSVMRKCIDKAARLAAYDDIPVLILGESGTGKEEMAKYIHKLSKRGHEQWTVLNCGAIPETLIESELFGSVRGAFTNAIDRKGSLELANGSTLFLDEVGEMSLETQVKLLRALQEGSFVPVGGHQTMKSDFRLLCATNKCLMAEVTARRFREDLFYRIAGTIVEIPPLRSRSDDLVPFAEFQLRQINRKFLAIPGYQSKTLGESAHQVLHSYQWPGNIRQLISSLKNAAVWTEGDMIEAGDLRNAIVQVEGISENPLHHPLGNGFVLDTLLDEIQKKYMKRALEESDDCLKEAARLLGFNNYETLQARLKKLDMHRPKWKRQTTKL